MSKIMSAKETRGGKERSVDETETEGTVTTNYTSPILSSPPVPNPHASKKLLQGDYD